MIPAEEALERLRLGNRRFASNLGGHGILTNQARRDELLAGQEPFAIILGCSDSRVPLEIIFDQGMRDLFVIRVAANIVAASQVGSVEFAVEQYKTALVLALGHSMCGAVTATLEELERPTENRSQNLRSIVDRIRHSVETLIETHLQMQPAELLHHAIRANIRVSANQLRHGSRILEEFIRDGRLKIVGAEYSLETGLVDFFDGVS